MQPASRPWWEQVTALVSLSVSGAVTGFSFVPSAPSDLTSPSGMPIHLLALEKSAHMTAAATGAVSDTALRSAIVNVAQHFLKMAASRTPAEMQAIIWHHDSIDGVDHGQSCAAFASLTLELGSQATGQQSWVTGGTSYPWPLHKWADARVDPNPSSLGITSVLQDAEAHGRWHPLGDGYQPLPGDWVLFDGHVEVVTNYTGGALRTIGGDSLPNLSVNAHRYPGALDAQGVAGFVNNGALSPATPGAGQWPAGGHSAAGHASPARSASRRPASDPAVPGPHASGPAASGGAASGAAGPGPAGGAASQLGRRSGRAAIPGVPRPGSRGDGRPDGGSAGHGDAIRPPARQPPQPSPAGSATARRPHHARATFDASAEPPRPGGAAIPGLSATPAASPGASGAAARSARHAGAPYRRHGPSVAAAAVPGAGGEQAFINSLVPGAIAAQRRYGVPASVTIAQAIDESGWGRSSLATRDHNLFGIKGTGPAGSVVLPTSEVVNGQPVSMTSPFRVYHDVGQSIDDHGKLLATSGHYGAAMASRHDPNAFAAALTGTYATDPRYGSKLIGLMRQYNLYRYDAAAPAAGARPARPGAASIPGLTGSHTPPPRHPTTAHHPHPAQHTAAPPTATSTPDSPTATSAPDAPTTTPGPRNGSLPPASTPGATQPPAPPTRTPVTTRPSAPRAGTPIVMQPVTRRTSTPAATHAPAPSTGAPAATQPATPPGGASMAGAGMSGPRGTGNQQSDIPGFPAHTPASSPGRTTAAASGAGHGAVAGRVAAGAAGSRRGAAGQPGDIPGVPAHEAPPVLTAPGQAASIPGAHADSGRGTVRSGPGGAGQGPAGPARGTPGSSPGGAGPGQGAPGPARGTPGSGRGMAGSGPGTPGAAGGQATGGAAAGRRADGAAAAPSPRPAPQPAPRPAPQHRPQHRPQAAPPGGPDSRPNAAAPAHRPPHRAARPAKATLLADIAEPAARSDPARKVPTMSDRQIGRTAVRPARTSTRRYEHHIPTSVWSNLVTSAKLPLLREEPLYRDVADPCGLRWELLAACDWMQCKGRLGYSPVHGEKLGTVNGDGSIYRTKSEALERCADDMVRLAYRVYQIDLTAPGNMSVRDLANVFAAFRWGGLLKLHHTSAMEFPYSVAGLTVQHTNMRWPNIADPLAPDRPGGRFRMPFGAVPIVLSLNYQATV